MTYLEGIPQLEMMTVRTSWPLHCNARREEDGRTYIEGWKDMREALEQDDKWPLICF